MMIIFPRKNKNGILFLVLCVLQLEPTLEFLGYSTFYLFIWWETESYIYTLEQEVECLDDYME